MLESSHCDLNKDLKIARALPMCFPWELMERVSCIERDYDNTCMQINTPIELCLFLGSECGS